MSRAPRIPPAALSFAAFEAESTSARGNADPVSVRSTELNKQRPCLGFSLPCRYRSLLA